MKNLWITGYAFALGLILVACAKQVAPTGGERDKTPPKIESSSPLNYHTNFRGVQLILEFDEFIVDKNFKEQLVASPPFEKVPELKIRGKRAEITIKEALRPNTTYTLNFGEGIADLNEGNPLDSNIFVFSTGDYIDSLSLSGSIRQAFDLKPAEELFVMLYDNLDDSVPSTVRPTYFAKTDKQGNFTFSNLAGGDYQLFALKDANKNYLFDQPSEEIAFINRTVNPAVPDSLPLQLNLFTEDAKKQYVKRAKAEHFGKILFVFNRPSPDLRIVPENITGKKAWYLEERLTNGDSIIVWLTDPVVTDTLTFTLFDGATALDTVDIAIPERKVPKEGKSLKGRKNTVKLTLKNNVKSSNYPYFHPLRLQASSPVKNYPQEVTIIEDSVSLKAPLKQLDEALRQFEVDYAFKQGVRYEIKFEKGSFTDIFNIQSDSAKVRFTTQTERDFGRFGLTFQAPDYDHPYVLQLLSENGDLLSEQVVGSNATIEFPNLKPAKYRLKLIYDSNGNGEWDTGSFKDKRQPEKVIFYSGELEVRAGWDLDIDWTVTGKL